MTAAAVGPSVVSTSQPRADSASCRPMATRAWSSTMSTRPVIAGSRSGSGRTTIGQARARRARRKRNTNVAPPPGRERTAIDPPCSAMRRRAMKSPSPEPVLSSPHTPRSNSRSQRQTGYSPPAILDVQRHRAAQSPRPGPRRVTAARGGGRCPAGPTRPAPCCHGRRPRRCPAARRSARRARTPGAHAIDRSDRFAEIELLGSGWCGPRAMPAPGAPRPPSLAQLVELQRPSTARGAGSVPRPTPRSRTARRAARAHAPRYPPSQSPRAAPVRPSPCCHLLT